MNAFQLSKCSIVDIPIDQIVPYSKNARRHPERQLEMLEASFRGFGVVEAILVTEDNELIAGHARLEAAKRMGMSAIPAIKLPHLNPGQIRALRIALNQIALKADWSIELLGEELEIIMAMDLDFEPISLGMEMGEIDVAIESARKASLGPNDPEPVPEPDRSQPPVSRVGDKFTIGRHVVVCGDSRDPDTYRLALDGRQADMVCSDMPWNLPASHISGAGKIKHGDFVMGSGEMSPAEFEAFVAEVLKLQAQFSKCGALILQFIDWRSVDVMIRAGKREIGDFVGLCIWVKQSASFGSPWRSRHELICVFRAKGAKSKDNVKLGKHGRNRSNIWEYDAPSGFGPERHKLALHPTAKNEKMVGDAILDVTDRNDIVLDAFLGSGTTVLAAHQTGRIGIGIELDAHYADLAMTRIAAATREPIIHADGRTFEELRADRYAEQGE